MKKALSIVFAVVFLFSYCVPVYAHNLSNDDGIFVTREMAERDKSAVLEMARRGQMFRENNTRGLRRSSTSRTLPIGLLHQDVGSWANKQIPGGCGTFAQYGCAMTSYTMVSRHFSNVYETPLTFATKYNNQFGNPCNQTAVRAADVLDREVVTGQYPSKTFFENLVIDAINANNPIVVRVKSTKTSSHYIVVYGYYLSSQGNVTIYIRDPESDWNYSTLSDYYSKQNATIMSYAEFS